MNPFAFIVSWFKRAVHVKAATLKGAPGVHPGQEQAVADHINAAIGTLIDAEAAKHGVTPAATADAHALLAPAVGAAEPKP